MSHEFDHLLRVLRVVENNLGKRIPVKGFAPAHHETVHHPTVRMCVIEHTQHRPEAFRCRIKLPLRIAESAQLPGGSSAYYSPFRRSSLIERSLRQLPNSENRHIACCGYRHSGGLLEEAGWLGICRNLVQRRQRRKNPDHTKRSEFPDARSTWMLRKGTLLVPEEFVEAAERLLAEASKEADQRSAVSCAYYGALHASRVSMHAPYSPTHAQLKSSGSHKAVIDGLTAWGQAASPGRSDAQKASRCLGRDEAKPQGG